MNNMAHQGTGFKVRVDLLYNLPNLLHKVEIGEKKVAGINHMKYDCVKPTSLLFVLQPQAGPSRTHNVLRNILLFS